MPFPPHFTARWFQFVKRRTDGMLPADSLEWIDLPDNVALESAGLMHTL
jgi:hypothetical protein